MHPDPDHLFSPSALAGALPSGPSLLANDPRELLRRIQYPTPPNHHTIRTELLPENVPAPIVVPARDPPGLPSPLAELFGQLRAARAAGTTDLNAFTGGAVTHLSQVRYAAEHELVLALPMVADLPDRLGLEDSTTPLGRAHPDELHAPGPLRILPDVEIHDAPGAALLAIRNGRWLALGDTAHMRRIVERLRNAATPAELAALNADAILNETIAVWLVRAGIAGRALPTAPHHRIWLRAGASLHGANEGARNAPVFDRQGLPETLTAILAEMGLRCEPRARTRIQLLRDGFSNDSRASLEHDRRSGITTIPVIRPGPERILIGPWLAPEGQLCPHCWHSTLREAASRPDLTFPLDPAKAPDTLPEGIGLYLAKHLIGLDRRRFIFALAVRTDALTKHPVLPDPTCPQCGHHRPSALAWGKKPVDVTRLPGLLDPITGTTGRPQTPAAPARVAPALRAFRVAFVAGAGNRARAAGKGRTPEGARAGALAEALERRSLSATPSHLLPAIRPRGHPDVNGPILETQDVDLYGTEQRPGGIDDTSNHPNNPRIAPTDPTEPRPLVRLRRLDGSPGPWIEAARVFALASADRDYPAARCSNGLAAAPTLEDAIFRAFAELVERDATALWWYSLCRRPAIPLEALGPTRAHALLAAEGLRSLGRDLAILDLATNRALPAVAAVSLQGGTRPLIGLGAGATHPIAASRAIAELWQHLNLATGEHQGAHRHPLRRAINRLDRRTAPWLTARGTECELIDTPAATAPLDLVDQASRELDIKAYWIDLTEPRLPLPVARVFAPGLRHFWRRTAPGRLYSEPHHLGWTRRPLPRHDLNRLELLL